MSNRTLDIKSSEVIINGLLTPSTGTLQVQGNLVINGSLTTTNLISNVEFENVTYSNVIIVKNVYVTNNLTTSPTSTANIGSDLVVNGIIIAPNFASNVLRISNLETRVSNLESNGGGGGGDPTLPLRVSNLESSNISLWSNISILRTQLTSNATRITNLETSNASTVARVSNLESNVSILSTQLTSNASRVGTLETSDTNFNLRVSNLETSNTSTVARVSNLESNVSILTTQLASNSSRITTLESVGIGALTTRVSNLESSNANVIIRVSNLEASNTSTVSRVSNLESNVSTIRQRMGIGGALSDETTTLTTSNFISIRAPYAFNINTASSVLVWLNRLPTTPVTIDIQRNGLSIYSVAPTISSTATSNSNIGVGCTLLGGSNAFAQYDLITARVTNAGSGTPAGAKFIIYTN